MFLLVLSLGLVIAQEDVNGSDSGDADNSGSSDDTPNDSGSESIDSADDFVEEPVVEVDGKVVICHIPPGNLENVNTISVDESSVEDHLEHGDYIGECEDAGIDLEEIEEEEGDVGEIISAGTTPDSIFYFIDEFFDRFGDDLNIREEKIAEIKAMIEEGNIEAAREALKGYKKRVQELKDEIDPDRRKDARRSAVRIKKALKDVERNLREEDKKEFVDDILEDEKSILIAAEISHKIRELCNDLHDLGAWDEFERVCKTDDDGPRWQKDFYESLTDEQRAEAEKFGRIMSSCMKTSGQECDCAGIPHEGMAAMCFEAAPLARACDLEDDELACDRLDNLEFPADLPRHLEEVMFRIEDEYGDASYDNHIPRACRDAGITGEDRGDREKCFEIMIEIEAPLECRVALKEAKVDNERDARRICEKIMFELGAPEECIERGITDPRECGELFGGDFGPGRGFDGGGPRGPDCRGIENPEDRLRCYDGAGHNFDDRYEERRAPDGPPGGWPDLCRQANAFTRESCEKIMRADGDRRFQETMILERVCAESCASQGKAWDFSFGCRCFDGGSRDYSEFYDDGGHDDFQDDYREEFKEEFREEFRDDFSGGIDCAVVFCQEGTYCDPNYGCVPDDSFNEPPFEEPTTEPVTESTTDESTTDTTTDTKTDTTTTDTTITESTQEEPDSYFSGSDGADITGGVISIDSDNTFLRYFYE